MPGIFINNNGVILLSKATHAISESQLLVVLFCFVFPAIYLSTPISGFIFKERVLAGYWYRKCPI